MARPVMSFHECVNNVLVCAAKLYEKHLVVVTCMVHFVTMYTGTQWMVFTPILAGFGSSSEMFDSPLCSPWAVGSTDVIWVVCQCTVHIISKTYYALRLKVTLFHYPESLPLQPGIVQVCPGIPAHRISSFCPSCSLGYGTRLSWPMLK